MPNVTYFCFAIEFVSSIFVRRSLPESLSNSMKIETLIHQTLGNHNFCIFTTFLIFTLFNQNFGDKKITEVHLRKLRADYFFHNVCFLQCVLYVLATV